MSLGILLNFHLCSMVHSLSLEQGCPNDTDVVRTSECAIQHLVLFQMVFSLSRGCR